MINQSTSYVTYMLHNSNLPTETQQRIGKVIHIYKSRWHADAIIQIARMAGYKVQKNTLPSGIKFMWLGFQALQIASEMYKNILSTNT